MEQLKVEGEREVFPAVFVYGLCAHTAYPCTVADKPYPVLSVIQYC